MAVIIDTPVGQGSGGYGSSYGSRRQQRDHGSWTIEQVSSQDFLNKVLEQPKRLHYVSRDKLSVVNLPDTRYSYGSDTPRNGARYGAPEVSLGIQALHQAFAAHVPFSLRPDTVWYFIVHQVAEHVRQNADKYAKLFTDTPGAKQVIRARDDSLRYDAPSDWGRAINLFRNPLREKVSQHTLELFLPQFSTSTPEDETALLVAFMDAASPFFEYRMQTLCGVPQVRLEGTADDWRQLYRRTEQLAREFDGLAAYFGELLPVVQEIAETAGGSRPNDDFWRSIYKYGGGSGGPYVNGWITAFFAYVQSPQGPKARQRFGWRESARGGFGGFHIDDFPSHVSKVPFIWEYFGQEIPMAFAAGVTGVDYDESFLTPRLGFAVAEV